MAKSLRRILILTKRNLKEIVRDPLSLVFTILLPLFMEILSRKTLPHSNSTVSPFLNFSFSG